MKRRNLLRTKKVLAVIIAASMSMSTVSTVLANEGIEEFGKSNSAEAGGGSQENGSNSVEARADNENVAKNVESASGTTAVDAQSSEGHSSTVDVKGDAEGTENNGSGDSKGVNAFSSDNNSKTSVTVGGGVSARDDNEATGIRADASDNSNTSVSAKSVYVEVTGTSSSGSNEAKGIDVNSESEGDTSVEIKEGVKARSEDMSTGVSVSSYHENSTSTVKAGGDVNVSGKKSSVGINSSANIGTSTTTVDGAIIVNSEKNSVGVTTSVANGGEVKVSIGSTIDAKSDQSSTSINVQNAYGDNDKRGSVEIESRSVNATADKETTGIQIQAVSQSDIDITINGDVNSSAKAGNAKGISSSLGTDATADIKVTGNVTSTGKDGTAVEITDAESSKTDLFIGGTISGEKHNVVLSSTTNVDNLNISVWKVDTSNGKNVVETVDNNYNYTKNEKAEKQINYIIKASSAITLSGTGTTVGDYYTEHQDNKVYLKVNIPRGLTAEFYDINGNNNYEIVPDGNGGAYLVVPRGGGVQVGVKVTPKNSTYNDTSNSGSSGNTQSDYGSSDSSDGGSSDSSSDDVSRNDERSNFGGVPSATQSVFALQVHTMSHAGSDLNQNITDVLKPIDTLTAINNFGDSGAPNMGTNNVKGTGIVNFNNMFLDSASDTVDVPVTADVYNGQTYTVMYSDGTSLQVPCLMNGVLNIPFRKNAEGLTYIIYGAEINPTMFFGTPTIYDLPYMTATS